MLDKPNYKFIIDKNNEILINLTEGVFYPTGTTTLLLNAVKGYIHKPMKMLDLGAGSGVIGLSLYKMGLATSPLYASDLSDKAIECMKRNSRLFNIPITTRMGPLFEPWKDEKFDYIVNDISGVAEDVARISPWFNNVPCDSGPDGTFLVIEVLKKASMYLNSGGMLFFPIISFSDETKILNVACANFKSVKKLNHIEWPLPKEMHQHIATLKGLKDKGYIRFTEKFGMVLWSTDIYVAFND